jgi:hypothetical protein
MIPSTATPNQRASWLPAATPATTPVVMLLGGPARTRRACRVEAPPSCWWGC